MMSNSYYKNSEYSNGDHVQQLFNELHLAVIILPRYYSYSSS